MQKSRDRIAEDRGEPRKFTAITQPRGRPAAFEIAMQRPDRSAEDALGIEVFPYPLTRRLERARQATNAATFPARAQSSRQSISLVCSSAIIGMKGSCREARNIQTR
ncbi:MAG TPA: hypothetical protein VJ922_05320 [Actinomycetota bacterium]|nr:hypothetical protein [Actinomycetota bacterium]